VALIGRPNVGKSTLMNRILGEKLSIVTDKPQTTRNKILGIKTTPRSQILFFDTPGVHKGRHRLNEIMVSSALSSLQDADLILFLIEPVTDVGEDEGFILEKLGEVRTPIYLIINKIDATRKDRILPVIEAYRGRISFEEALPISAFTGEGVAQLEEMIVRALPEGPPFFPAESITDVSQRFMIGEMIREKIILRTHREIPYAVTVVVEAVKRRETGALTDVEAVIYVEKDSQKGILIGSRGAMLKEIGSQVRPEIEAFLEGKVFLRLWVKVRKDWRSQVGALREFGFQ
jgi:GTP-binding protein Era